MKYLHLKKKRKDLYKLAVIYSLMVTIIITIVALIVAFLLGFRFNISKGNIEQYAFLQFSSTPSGAVVTIDGKTVSSKTPNKDSAPSGKHDIVMWRDGYETWKKTVDLKSGTLNWLNYALLVPKKLTVEPVVKYTSLAASLASPEGRSMIILENSNQPTFNLVDLSSDTIKSTNLTIPVTAYSDAAVFGLSHTFQIDKWDNGGRYLTIKHTYGDEFEWLVLDTQDVASTKNITKTLNITTSKILFSGTSGNLFFALDSAGDIRKINLADGNLSRPLVSGVTDFNLYETNLITYNKVDPVGKQTVGLYQDGDEKSYDLRSIEANKGTQLKITIARYFNEDYVAISDGKKIDILSGSYPNTANGDAASLKVISSFSVDQDVQNLSFSPSSEYVFVQSGAYFASYDLEYKALKSSTIEGDGATPTFKWLDDNYIWSDRDEKLTIREFDGENIHFINQVVIGQSVVITHNGRYIYSFNKSDVGYQLQRVRMILP
jgi:hypothetical protein